MVWAYVVRNTSPSMLNRIVVADERGVGIFCPKSQLAAGESMTCTARVVAPEGIHEVRSTVTGTSPCDVLVSDSQTSYYQGTEAVELDQIEIQKYGGPSQGR